MVFCPACKTNYKPPRGICKCKARKRNAERKQYYSNAELGKFIETSLKTDRESLFLCNPERFKIKEGAR